MVCPLRRKWHARKPTDHAVRRTPANPAHCSISRIAQPGTNSKSKHVRRRSSYSPTSGSNDTAAAEVLRGPSTRTVDQHASGPATAKTLELQRLRARTNVRGPLRRTDSGAKLQRSSECSQKFPVD